jgi:pSer/pThr/pTyr-binding forkhead associated (FHA) protein
MEWFGFRKKKDVEEVELEQKIVSATLYVFVSHNLNNEHILRGDVIEIGRAGREFSLDFTKKWTRMNGNKIEVGYLQNITSMISGKHLKLKKQDDGRYSVADVGSKYGTFINGKPLIPGEDIILEDENKINIGHGDSASSVMFQIKYVYS